MDNLQDILYKSGVNEVIGTLGRTVSGITADSRAVEEGFLFVAVRGTKVDGHNFIDKAVEKGAGTIVCEILPESLSQNVTYVRVSDSAKALGFIASNFYDNPSEKLDLIGVTGTNGKTTTVTLLYNLFKKLGYKTGLLSTILYKIHDKEVKSTHTTPDAVSLNKLLNEMVEEGCSYAFMEVSSHAIHQHRIAGLKFKGGVFTNITHDHLDYHKTFKDYLLAKKKFFDDLPFDAFALVNADDKNGRVMLQNTRAAKYTYGLKSLADFKGKVLESQFDNMLIDIDGNQVYTFLVGEFNAYNLLAVYGTAVLLNQDKQEVLTHLSTLKGADGRFEVIRSKNGITVIIDYAHTPDALENVLKTINKIRTGNEQLTTVVGAGGDRDKEKRPKMAKIASRLSNRLILTSDNPRSEDPEKIIEDMQQGVDIIKKNVTLSIVDRKEAIKMALLLSQPGDIVLIAGKGHENYQEIKGVKHHFDDKEVVMEIIKNL